MDGSTAREDERMPEFNVHGPEREMVSRRKRWVCGNDQHLTEGLMRMTKSGRGPRDYPVLDPASLADLKAMGFTDDMIEQIHGPESLSATAPA